jgi:hypothetical protein
VALTIHFYEAVLACLAIAVWHFYHVMFDPDVYPVNPAFWDGRVSRHWMEEEHPLDESLRAAAALQENAPAGRDGTASGVMAERGVPPGATATGKPAAPDAG